MSTQAILALEDGTVFKGVSIGATGSTIGEVVFNTAMTGYQEILTDPSYHSQIVTLTYPHIGNTGVNDEDPESRQPWAAGLIIRDASFVDSNWRSKQSLSDYLKAHNIVAIADIDTRKLTRIIRDKGAMGGCILAGEGATEEEALAKAKGFEGLSGKDIVQDVTCEEVYEWNKPSWTLTPQPVPEKSFHVAVYDFGVKRNSLRLLVDRGCKVTVVPAKTPVEDVLALKPDGVFLSNGPGDPEPCEYAIEAAQGLLEANMPIFGICLGHQLLGLAVGGRTLKMKFGHHGANHPIKNLENDQVWITSQNHGFAVDQASLPSNVKVTHISLFDNTLQGMKLTDKPAISMQGHPEAGPGPNDATAVFDQFIELMQAARAE